jgi:outer membrane protein TolC
MRPVSVLALPALSLALSLGVSDAYAQHPPAAPANIDPKQVVDAPMPTMEQIAANFDPEPNGLTSDEVVRRALEHSPELKKAMLSEDTAAANKARAKLAFAPRFDFGGKYQHVSFVKQPDFFGPLLDYIGSVGQAAGVPPPMASGGFGSGAGFPQVLDQWYTQAGVMMPVTDVFLTVVPTYKAADLLSGVAEQRRMASELQVSFDARVAFYDYAHVIGAVVVAHQAAELLENSVRDLEALVQAGAATETDLMRSRAELAKIRASEVELAGMRDVALRRLVVITGTEFDPKRGIGERFVGIELGATPELADLTAEAKRVRPELIALRKLEKARDYLARAKRGAQYPKLNGFGNGYYANPHPRVIPQTPEWRTSWDVGVMLSWSPNDSIYAHTQYNDALTDLASVREDLRLVEDGISMETAHAVSSHRAAVHGIDATTQVLEAARRYQRDQRSMVLAGAATPNDLLLAQVQLTRAALEWVDSFIKVRQAEAALLKARGQIGLNNKGSVAQGSSKP